MENSIKIRNKMSVFICILIISIVVVSSFIYAGVGELIVEYFASNKTIEYAEELLDKNGQSYKIEDYSFTLKQTLYDDKIKCGYLVFEIKKDNGTPEIELNHKGQNISDKGVANRFNIKLYSSGSYNKKYKYIKDTLYLYYDFSVDKDYDNTVKLIDYYKEDNSSEYGYKTYEFTIKNTSNAKTYRIDDESSITISPLGIVIDVKEELCNAKIEVIYRNRKKDVVFDSSTSDNGIKDLARLTSSDLNNLQSNYVRYKYKFKELVDIDNIVYIRFNDIKLSEM